jgi:hypothetical protein
MYPTSTVLKKVLIPLHEVRELCLFGCSNGGFNLFHVCRVIRATVLVGFDLPESLRLCHFIHHVCYVYNALSCV